MSAALDALKAAVAAEANQETLLKRVEMLETRATEAEQHFNFHQDRLSAVEGAIGIECNATICPIEPGVLVQGTELATRDDLKALHEEVIRLQKMVLTGAAPLAEKPKPKARKR